MVVMNVYFIILMILMRYSAFMGNGLKTEEYYMGMLKNIYHSKFDVHYLMRWNYMKKRINKMQRYYEVTDFEGISSYYNNYADAKKLAENLKKEMIDGDWKGVVDITSFNLPHRMPLKQVVPLLLNREQFMTNRKKIIYFERE